MVYTNDFYKELIENAPYAYAYVKTFNDSLNNKAYFFADANSCFCKLIQLEHEEIVGAPIEKGSLFFNANDIDLNMILHDASKNNEKKSFKKYLSCIHQWYQIIVHSPEEGAFAVLLIQLTEENNLSKIEEKNLYKEYCELLLSFGDLIIEIDDHYVVKDIKTAPSISKMNLTGKNITHIIGQEAAVQYINAFEQARKTEKVVEIEYKENFQCSECIYHRVKIIYSKNDQKTSGFIALVRNITKEKMAELELRIKTEELELFFDILPGLLCAFDKEGNIIKFNKKVWNRVLGYSFHELEKMRIEDLVHKEDTSLLSEATQNHMEKAGTFYHSNRYLHKNGTYRYISWNCYFDGEYFYAIASDISQIKKYEKEHIAQEKFLKTLIDTIPHCIFYKDLNGHYIGGNKAKGVISGLEEKDLIGKTDLEIYNKDLAKQFMEQDLEVLEKKKTLVYEEEISINGEKRHYETIKAPFYNDYGKLSGIIGISRDVTNRIISQERIKESEERFRQIAENIEEAFWLSTDKEMLYISPGFERIWDRSCETVYTDIANFRNYIYKEDEQRVLDALKTKKYIEEGYFSEKYRIVKPDGTLRWVWEKIFPIKDTSGKIIRRAGIIEDITTLKIAEEVVAGIREEMMQVELRKKSMEIEQLGELDKLRTDFFANLSHELRTPINLILAALKMIELNENELENKNMSNQRYLKIMRQNSYRLMRLINNLIDVTRIDAGFLSYNALNWDIIYMIKSITLSVAVYAKSKNISLSFESDINSLLIKCDPDKIERILLNLLSNAIKYNKENGSVIVSVEKVEKEIWVSISDTGIGIPKDKLNLIFERFKQVDSRLTKEGEGSGIGLSLVKAFVEMHGGTISVKSILGVGTDFLMKLPIIKERGYQNDKIMEDDHCEDLRIERIRMEFSDIYGIEF